MTSNSSHLQSDGIYRMIHGRQLIIVEAFIKILLAEKNAIFVITQAPQNVVKLHVQEVKLLGGQNECKIFKMSLVLTTFLYHSWGGGHIKGGKKRFQEKTSFCPLLHHHLLLQTWADWAVSQAWLVWVGKILECERCQVFGIPNETVCYFGFRWC